MISIFLPNAGQKLVEVGPGGALEEKPPTKKTSAYRKSSKFVATIEKSSIKNLADRNSYFCCESANPTRFVVSAVHVLQPTCMNSFWRLAVSSGVRGQLQLEAAWAEGPLLSASIHGQARRRRRFGYAPGLARSSQNRFEDPFLSTFLCAPQKGARILDHIKQKPHTHAFC
jgi:hypothetical protein